MSWSTTMGRRVKLSFTGPESISKTLQSFAKDADINVLMGRYKSPDLLAAAMSALGSSRVPRFGDFSNIPDYMSICNSMRAADEAFASLPATVRDRFGNSVSVCLDFIADPKNRDEAVKLGLLDAPVVPAPVVSAPVVSAPVVPVANGAAPDKVTPTPPKAVS